MMELVPGDLCLFLDRTFTKAFPATGCGVDLVFEVGQRFSGKMGDWKDWF